MPNNLQFDCIPCNNYLIPIAKSLDVSYIPLFQSFKTKHHLHRITWSIKHQHYGGRSMNVLYSAMCQFFDMHAVMC